ncbi:MAG: hypothetical protein GY821_03780 [Gammaproteobacteria bacterium]|nr:hypothetical protein [Gammaproteobacteria bacterium]
MRHKKIVIVSLQLTLPQLAIARNKITLFLVRQIKEDKRKKVDKGDIANVLSSEE